MTAPKTPDVFGGGFYGRLTPGGPLVPAPPQRPEAWVCRRLRDFASLPEGAALAACSVCGFAVAFNPRTVWLPVAVTTPKVCMQCAGIEPLPLEE